MERFAHKIAVGLQKTLQTPITSEHLEIPPDPEMGDFAFPCFRLAKQFKNAPAKIAQDLAKQMGEILKSEKISCVAQGPYLNFSVSPQTVIQSLLPEILSDSRPSYGKLEENSRGSWVLEFSSPNIAKPFQIYHLRPTALGAALSRIGEYRGFKVTSINHLGDWGTQYGKLAVALRLYEKSLPKEPQIKDLVQIYVKFHEEAEKNPKLEDEAREAFRKLEAGDPELQILWRKCVDISLKEFKRIYHRIGVSFTHIWGESHYKDLLEPLIQELKEKGIAIESEGAWVVPVTDPKGNELPPCILQKKDGATIYATRDLAAAIYRYQQFCFDRMTYIVGGEQKLHFQQVFDVLRQAGYSWVSKCEHVPTGIYRFQEGGKMSTRKGKFVTLEETLELAKSRVIDLMRSRGTQTEEEIQANAEAIAIGSVVFFDLSSDPAKDVEFDLNRTVDFDGETGSYLQYAHTRCLSILRKAKESNELTSSSPIYHSQMESVLQHPREIQLVKILGQFPLFLERSLQFSKANQLTQYLIQVTKAYNSFYRECHVLGQPSEITMSRLGLVEATRRILNQGLQLLGVPLPERM